MSSRRESAPTPAISKAIGTVNISRLSHGREQIKRELVACLVRDGFSSLGDAIGAGRVDSAASSAEPGYGVSVVPLQYVSAQTILKLLDSFATKPGSVRADVSRNLLLIQGTGEERRAAVETVMSFDVDFMRGQSVGIFPISNGAPAPIIAELEKIMDSSESGLGQGVVKFQAISRLNAILVVSRKPALLKTAATWIRPSPTTRSRSRSRRGCSCLLAKRYYRNGRGPSPSDYLN